MPYDIAGTDAADYLIRGACSFHNDYVIPRSVFMIKKKVSKVKKGKEKKSGFRRIIKIGAVIIGFFLVLVIGASIAVYMIVDKPFVEGQMSRALHRQVSIGDVNVSVLSVLSGIEVNDTVISNYKSDAELAKVQGKAIAPGDRFVVLKSFRFKIAFAPLLQKQIVLKELVLDGLTANVVRYKSGLFNFSDLMVAKPKTAEEKAAEKKELAAKKKEEKTAKAEPSKPLSADDIPVKVNVGLVGLEKGNVNFTDISTGQKLSIYNITAKVFDISIDPKDLANNDIVKISLRLGIKTIGTVAGGSVKSFDILASADGFAIPFDKGSRLLNPEVSLKVGSSRGMLTGLQIFDKMKSVSALEKYTGKFDFLKDNVNWKNAFVSVWYKNNLVKLSDGKIDTDDFTALFGAQVNLATLSIKSDIDLSIEKKHTDSVKTRMSKNIDKLIVGKAKKVVKADKITETAMKPLVNPDGKINLKYAVKGTVSSPDVDLVSPKLGDLKDIVKEAAGDLLDDAKDKVKEKAKEKVEEKKTEAKGKAKSKAKSSLKKLKL